MKTRSLGITDHAIERLRERLGKDVKARTNDDLGDLIDAETAASLSAKQFTTVMDNGVEAKLVRLDGLPSEVTLYAIVKENDKDLGYACKYVVVTLYTQEMVDDAKRRGRWDMGDGKKSPSRGAPVTASMGDKLKASLSLSAMTGKPLAVAPAAPLPPPPKPPNVPKKVVPELAAKSDAADIAMDVAKTQRIERATPVAIATKSVETRLVTWRKEADDGSRMVKTFAEYPRAEIEKRMEELLDDPRVDAKSVRVWKEVKTVVKLTVEDD